MAMAQKEMEVAMAQKEMEVAQAKMALLQSQLDQKNRDLLAARGEMSARYMLERYVDKIKAEARPAETRTKPLLRQVQKLQNQSSAAQQMVDAVKACATIKSAIRVLVRPFRTCLRSVSLSQLVWSWHKSQPLSEQSRALRAREVGGTGRL